MAHPLANILALDFSAATGRGRLLLHGGQDLDRGGIRRPFRQAGCIRLAGARIGDWRVPAPPLSIALGLSRAASRDEAASGLGRHNRDFGPAAP